MWFSGYWYFTLSGAQPENHVSFYKIAVIIYFYTLNCTQYSTNLYKMKTNVRVHTTSVLEHRYANFVFQYALASVVPLIVSAAVAERVRFEGYLIFSALCSGAFIYRTCTLTMNEQLSYIL